MEPETIVIITGEHSSCLKETKFGGDPITECVSVHVGNPESVYVMNGRRTLYTESDMKAERQAGQNEAWALARKIVKPCLDGGYTVKEINDIFGCGDPLGALTYKAAAEKADAWEEAHRMLEVGTVVKVVKENIALCGKRGFIIDAANTLTGPAYLVVFRNGESYMLRHNEIEQVALYDLGPLFALMEDTE